MAIKKIPVPFCDCCGEPWLPKHRLAGGALNPLFEHPERSKRCGKCKKATWNAGGVDGRRKKLVIAPAGAELNDPELHALCPVDDPNLVVPLKDEKQSRHNPLSPAAIAKLLGVSREGVTQAQRRAAGKCRYCDTPALPELTLCAFHRTQKTNAARKRLGASPWKPGGRGRPPIGAMTRLLNIWAPILKDNDRPTMSLAVPCGSKTPTEEGYSGRLQDWINKLILAKPEQSAQEMEAVGTTSGVGSALSAIPVGCPPQHWAPQIMQLDEMEMLLGQIDWQKDNPLRELSDENLPSLIDILQML